MGPTELPRDHPINKSMALPVFVISIGMFLIPIANLFGIIGIVICIIGLFWYSDLFKKARLEFPAMTDAERLTKARVRYARMTDIKTGKQEEKEIHTEKDD